MSAWYTFDKQTDIGFSDISGRIGDAVIHGDVYFDKKAISSGAAKFGGNCGYLEIPAEALGEFKNVTIEMWFSVSPQNYWERAFDFGRRDKDGKLTGYIFFAPAARKVVFSKIGHYSDEVVLEINKDVAMDGWTHFVLEIKDGSVFVYINGRLCASLLDESLKTDDYNGLNYLYIGKSQYPDDPYLCASVGEFHIYDKLLSSKDIHDKYTKGLSLLAENEIESVSLYNISFATKNIPLPRHLPMCRARLSWSSANKELISDNGEVRRPKASCGNEQCRLTAYVEGTAAEKTFTITVVKEFTDEETVLWDKDKVSLSGILDSLTHDLELPLRGDEGSLIQWTGEGAIDDSGKICRPALGEKEAHGRLTATFTKGEATAVREFEITIPAEEAPGGYLFAYFTGNNINEERLHLAITTDCYNFSPLNGGKHIFRQTKGTTCLRDPFLIRGEDGYYYLIATDMQSSKGWDSNRGFITWKSEDLINWTDETVIDIADKFPTTLGADRIWAPQALFHKERGEYMLYFAVRVHRENAYSRELGLSENETHMWYAYTKDFKSLTCQPKLLFMPNEGQGIDGDIYFKDGVYNMFYKDESNARLKLTRASAPDGPYGKEMLLDTGFKDGLEGVCVYKVLGEEKWLLIADAYGAGHYVMAETTDLKNFSPVKEENYSFKGFHPRHGHLIPVSQRQIDRLINAFGI